MLRRISQRIVDAPEFCLAWKSAARRKLTVAQLADILEMQVNAVYNRGTKYREAGVKLPELAKARRGRKAIDVAHLNRILRG